MIIEALTCHVFIAECREQFSRFAFKCGCGSVTIIDILETFHFQQFARKFEQISAPIELVTLLHQLP